MRHQLLKLSRGHSTRAERRFAELCKKHRIKFRTKVRIDKYEIDFVIKNYAIEIDSHVQNVKKNQVILSNGYNLIHLPNSQISLQHTEEWLRKL